MIVSKFGGTSIADAQPILRVASIAASRTGKRAVVVPALAGATDRPVCLHDRYAASPVTDSAAERTPSDGAELPDDTAPAGASS